MRLRVLTFLALLAAALCVPAGAQAFPGQRYDMKVLVISADGNEPTFPAWVDALEREGVPYDTMVATSAAADHGRARSSAGPAALALPGRHHRHRRPRLLRRHELRRRRSRQSEWDALYALGEQVRHPPDHGVHVPVAGLRPQLPDRVGQHGRRIAASCRPRPRPAPGATSTAPCRSRTSGATRPRRSTRPASRRSSSAAEQLQPGGHLPPAGTAARRWSPRSTPTRTCPLPAPAPRHAELGHARRLPRLPAQLPDAARGRRLPAGRALGPGREHDREEGPNPIRMTPSDVLRAVIWQNATGQRIDMPFNGAGSEATSTSTAPTRSRRRCSPTEAASTGRTTPTATWSSTTSRARRSRTRSCATSPGRRARARFDPTELVTGEHSGLHNPNMAQALTDTGISYVRRRQLAPSRPSSSSAPR